MNNAAVRDCLARLAPTRTFIAISSAIAALILFPLAAFAITYEPGQTLNPSCLPTDPTCVVATSTFAGNITVAGTASSTDVVVSSTLSIGGLSGFLKEVAGVVTTALVNLTTDVTGILPVANGGTGWANIAAGSILFGNGSSAIATSSNLYWDNTDRRLGIGTASPTHTLSIWEAGPSGFFGISSTTSGDIFNVLPNGNVGIGSSSPASLLSVAGNVSASTYQLNNQTVLSSSGGGLSVGLSADAPSGIDDTALGTYALANSGTGYGATAVGYEAMDDMATSGGAWFDTAVGAAALEDVTGAGGSTGFDLTGVGFAALQDDTTGAGNTGIGDQAIIHNTTGGANTAIGENVEYNAYSPTSTVAVGDNAANPGSAFSATGFTVVGYDTATHLQNNANYNTFLGYQSGADVTTGSSNIFIGPEVNSGGSHTTTGAANICIGYNCILPGGATANNALNIGNFIFGTGLTATSSGTSIAATLTGNLGLGTSSPSSRLTVWGPDAASSTLAFNVVNSASTTVFSVFDGGNAELSGSLSQSSDERLKTNITSLDASSSLSAIDSLNPVTFNWIDPDQGGALQLGFIAQQVQQVFPNLVSTTSATALTPDGTLSLNYIGLISPIVSAVQELSADITSIENTIAGFAASFTTQQLTFTRDLCAEQSDGTQICITGDQLAALVAQAGEGSGVSDEGGSVSNSADDATDTPPQIQINGDNPAIIQVGATYNDLGATIEGPQQDLNLGIQTFVNGVAMSPVQIDTTEAATDTIDYVATDQNGLTSTSTRTIIIEPLQAPSIVASEDESTTDATTTEATTTAQ